MRPFNSQFSMLRPVCGFSGKLSKEEHAADELQRELRVQVAALGDRVRGFLVLVLGLARCEAGL